MTKKVTIYTTTTCAYCDMVKKFLTGKGVPYTVINLDEKPPELRQKIIDLSGAMTVPVVVVEDTAPEGERQDVVVGWNPAKLTAAVQGLEA